MRNEACGRPATLTVSTQFTAVTLKVAIVNVPLVTVEGVLRLRRRLPLVAPDDIEAGPVEREVEATDSGKQLGDGGSAAGFGLARVVVVGHVDPCASSG